MDQPYHQLEMVLIFFQSSSNLSNQSIRIQLLLFLRHHHLFLEVDHQLILTHLCQFFLLEVRWTSKVLHFLWLTYLSLILKAFFLSQHENIFSLILHILTHIINEELLTFLYHDSTFFFLITLYGDASYENLFLFSIYHMQLLLFLQFLSEVRVTFFDFAILPIIFHL